MRSATIPAWRSENVRTRSGCSARILSIFADVKALTRGFSRRACGGAHDVARDTHDAVLLAEQVERLDGLFGEADNSARRKHQSRRAQTVSDLNLESGRLPEPASSRGVPRQQPNHRERTIISVIIPTLNEEGSLPALLDAIHQE